MSSVTVCLTNWLRPDYLARTISSVRSQINAPTLYLWNNGRNQTFDGVDWTIHSSVNKMCWPRWFMASCANTEFVCIIDDDVVLLESSVLNDIVIRMADLPSTCIVGVEGVNLISGKSYKDSDHVRVIPHRREDVPCDIIKGKFMMARTEAIRNKLIYGGLDDFREDDIVVSALLSGGARRHHLCLADLGRNLALLDAPHALWQEPGHFERRQLAAEKFFSP